MCPQQVRRCHPHHGGCAHAVDFEHPAVFRTHANPLRFGT